MTWAASQGLKGPFPPYIDENHLTHSMLSNVLMFHQTAKFLSQSLLCLSFTPHSVTVPSSFVHIISKCGNIFFVSVSFPLLKNFRFFPLFLFGWPRKMSVDFFFFLCHKYLSVHLILIGKCCCHGGSPFYIVVCRTWWKEARNSMDSGVDYLRGLLHCTDSQVSCPILSSSWLNSFKVNSIICLHLS